MSKEVNMNEESFAIKLVEKQLRRSEYHFYAVCILFFVFMVLAYLMPASSEVNAIQDVDGQSNHAENRIK